MDVSKQIGGLIIPQFPGNETPSVDFDDVRSGQRARLLYFDLDLSIARSIAAGTHSLLQFAGNSFFIDQFTSAGFATAYFQDTNLAAKGAPVYVGPGFIAHVPFTQVLFENVAQPGKILRVIFGVDVDFSPGLAAAVTATINGTVTVQGTKALSGTLAIADAPVLSEDTGFLYGAAQSSTAALAQAGTEQVFSAASNVNGAIIWAAECFSDIGVVGVGRLSLNAKATAPTLYNDGDVILTNAGNFVTGSGYIAYVASLARSVRIAAGKGLWWIHSPSVVTTENASARKVLYSLL